MSAGWTALGALLCALSIAAGAFGAHALRGRLAPPAVELWETAARYLVYTGLALIGLGLAAGATPRPGFALAGGALLAGGVVFAVSLAILALGGPRWVGAVTPLGGLAMIFGFVVFAWVALRG